MELERVFCCWIFFTYIQVYFYGPLQGGGDRPHRRPPMDPPLPWGDLGRLIKHDSIGPSKSTPQKGTSIDLAVLA